MTTVNTAQPEQQQQQQSRSNSRSCCASATTAPAPLKLFSRWSSANASAGQHGMHAMHAVGMNCNHKGSGTGINSLSWGTMKSERTANVLAKRGLIYHRDFMMRGLAM